MREIREKTIVLTGSAVPFAAEKSDAMFNLGGAVITVQKLPNGVYVVMNGRIFQWNNVRKNLKTGRFEEIHHYSKKQK
jgi:L-asparaginase